MIRGLENINSESRLKELAFFSVRKTEEKCGNTTEIRKRIYKVTGNNFFPCLWDRMRLQQGRVMFNITKTCVWKEQ